MLYVPHNLKICATVFQNCTAQFSDCLYKHYDIAYQTCVISNVHICYTLIILEMHKNAGQYHDLAA